MVLCFMDTLEEHRDLSLQEWNFRNILQNHINALLKQQMIYWKQRGIIKWVKFGDECTEFFQSFATIKYIRSVITSITNADGNIAYDHEKKAELLWNAYKDRLGTSEFTRMHFDLASLPHHAPNLDWLHDPFSKEEIDKIISQLPTHVTGIRWIQHRFHEEMLCDYCRRFL